MFDHAFCATLVETIGVPYISVSVGKSDAPRFKKRTTANEHVDGHCLDSEFDALPPKPQSLHSRRRGSLSTLLHDVGPDSAHDPLGHASLALFLHFPSHLVAASMLVSVVSARQRLPRHSHMLLQLIHVLVLQHLRPERL